MKPTIWIFSIEPIETRYTKQWQEHIPKLFTKNLGDKFNVVQVDGVQKNSQLTPGAFLNFSDTNYWKSSQLCNFLEHHNNGETTTNDHILFTDAWNPTVIQIKYMKELLGFNWKLHGLFHAGSYDPEDFLGRLVGDAPWVRFAEKSFYTAYDHNYFATDFHIELFTKNLLGNHTATADFMKSSPTKKIVRSGWPMEYMQETLAPYKSLKKRDLILFPHRLAPEKQVEIFRDLAKQLPQYEFIVCQETQLSKHEYHTLLGEAKIVFSANLQETLGISTCAEAPLLNSVPLAPDRLSYSEIFKNHRNFLYPSKWTLNWDMYQIHKAQLVEKVIFSMENYEKLLPVILDYNSTSYLNYFTARSLMDNIK